jgi:chemotaxis protein MotB
MSSERTGTGEGSGPADRRAGFERRATTEGTGPGDRREADRREGDRREADRREAAEGTVAERTGAGDRRGGVERRGSGSKAAPKPKTIILIRRKRVHGRHHGGAWKVAYADFVTAMMALFIVLWLMNTSDHVKQAVAGYFNDPRGRAVDPGTGHSGAADMLPLTKQNLEQLKQALEKEIAQQPKLAALSKQIEITITPEGLRIELLESKDGTFFETGSAVLNGNGRELLTLLAHELGGVPNRVSIEGHTDSRAYAEAAIYGNWELSSDRANAARRLMEHSGLRPAQISQVRGFADRQLRVKTNPLDPSNRRISVIVHYLEAPAPQALAQAGQTAERAKELPKKAAVAEPKPQPKV